MTYSHFWEMKTERWFNVLVSGGATLGQACGTAQEGRLNPRAPCGCPCCWVNDCLNTDAACCVGFCNRGNDGAGCCPQ